MEVTARHEADIEAARQRRAVLRPLDAMGTSTDPEVVLAPEPGWESEGGIASSRFTAVNADTITVPAADWDVATHARVPGRASFVVYLEHPADLHGNVLNDLARAFSVTRALAVHRIAR